MSATPPPKSSQTLLGALTQAVQTVQAKINLRQLKLKPDARVAQLWVQDPKVDLAELQQRLGDDHVKNHSSIDRRGNFWIHYPLLGDFYKLGRSRSNDIAVRNPLVSSTHASLRRAPKRASHFLIKDEGSTNGIYRGKRRVKQPLLLNHGDRITLGPPELVDAVQLRFVNPPPWYIAALRYGLYGFTGCTALIALWILVEWQRFSVHPLPASSGGPVVVYARDGQPLQQPLNQSHQEYRRLSEFSADLPKAVVASEDSRFYWHLGVDPIGILRAVVTNVRSGELQEGASTITQQVARSLFRDYVGTEDSAGRKIREMIVALKLEMFYSKNALLLTYLNRVYLGNGNYGFEDAAQFYFGKSANSLTLSESATLVGILPAPNLFNPIRDYELAVRQRNGVLTRMVVLGMISNEEAQRARRSRIEINPKAKEQLSSTIAPYFYDHVFAELETVLGKDLAQEGNFFIETGLDPVLQAQAEATLRGTLSRVGGDLGVSQGAIVTLDSQSGEIQAMVGGVSYQASQFNRATQALRQPGSTFKIFTYAAALLRGISPSQSFNCGGLNWQGQSFGGCEHSGGATDMYGGLAWSENVIALRVAQEVGLNRVVETARRMGIEAKLDPVPGLVLGQSEVTVLEMTGAYSVLANRGMRNWPHAIRRVLDSGDCRDRKDPKTCRIIYDFADSAEANRPALEPDVADTMTVLLRGVVQSGTGRNAYLGLGEVGKTGTTNNNVDSWFIGYLPNPALTTGVWLGNDDNSPTSAGSGVAAQVWGDYMERVVRR